MKRYFLLLLLISICAHATNEFDCMIEPYHTVDLRSPVIGLIQQIHVTRGTQVKKDAPLVTIDSGVESTAADVAKFKSLAQGSLQVAQSKLSAALEKAKRSQTLFDEEFISAQALDEAEAAYKLAEAEVKSAEENLQLAKLEHSQTQATLNRRILKSPFPGVVVNVFLSPGALVDTSETKKPILKLVETDRLKVEAFVQMKYFNEIHKNDIAVIKPEAPLKGEYSAQITSVDSIIDSASGTFGVLIELNNPNGDIPAGTRCKFSIKGASGDTHLKDKPLNLSPSQSL